MSTEPIRHLIAAVAAQKKGRQLQNLAAQTLTAIDDGERVAGQHVTDAELVDIAILLLGAIEDENHRQVEAIAVGIAAVPGVGARLLQAVGACAIVFADGAGLDWRDELAMQRARVIVTDALGS
ncbi:hypothetical protein [Microbacterium caowuchunii]|uniref:Uncharacterized protein n=1 Tax=Microbacterium caowuchunii TaxID=2614638 RepID=A0A5N0TK74_9MICO|nr:hypothetical protein [Microbacterium caowuchunii]KAA9134838.1 hypothetical protein F6B40_03835 [Microbacterium caowuchunii]